jgi:hypothetical protein
VSLVKSRLTTGGHLEESPRSDSAVILFRAAVSATTISTPAQSECTTPNAVKGEGKFTGQISTVPDGSSMEVMSGDQTVLVHYSNSVTVCQGGMPASLDALTRGANVSVSGPMRRNGKNLEINATRIFVAAPVRTDRSKEAALPNARQAQPARPITEPAQPIDRQISATQGSTPEEQAILQLQQQVANLENRMAAVETFVSHTKDACNNVNYNLRTEPVGFRCITSAGAFYERVSKDQFGEAWEGPTGMIWSSLIGTLPLDDAKKKCSSIHGTLPTLADFQREAQSGFVEVLPPSSDTWLLTSTQTGATVYMFFPPSGQAITNLVNNNNPETNNYSPLPYTFLCVSQAPEPRLNLK